MKIFFWKFTVVFDYNQSESLMDLEKANYKNIKHQNMEFDFDNSRLMKTLREPKQRPPRPRPTRTIRTRP